MIRRKNARANGCCLHRNVSKYFYSEISSSTDALENCYPMPNKLDVITILLKPIKVGKQFPRLTSIRIHLFTSMFFSAVSENLEMDTFHTWGGIWEIVSFKLLKVLHENFLLETFLLKFFSMKIFSMNTSSRKYSQWKFSSNFRALPSPLPLMSVCYWIVVIYFRFQSL